MARWRKSFLVEDHYSDVTMTTVASQITSLTIVYSTVYSGADQRIHQSSAPLAFVRGIHRWAVNSPHKGPVTRKYCPCLNQNGVKCKKEVNDYMQSHSACCDIIYHSSLCPAFHCSIFLQRVILPQCTKFHFTPGTTFQYNASCQLHYCLLLDQKNVKICKRCK